MNFFKKTQQVSPRKHSGSRDLESLLPETKDTPPKAEPLQESAQQICGLPVQLVAGIAYCVGGKRVTASILQILLFYLHEM